MYPEGGGIRLLRNTDDCPQDYTIHGLRTMSQFVVGHLPRGSHFRSWALWDLWWTKWSSDRLFFNFSVSPVSVSFQKCSIIQ